jgi:hypothetical protein
MEPIKRQILVAIASECTPNAIIRPIDFRVPLSHNGFRNEYFDTHWFMHNSTPVNVVSEKRFKSEQVVLPATFDMLLNSGEKLNQLGPRMTQISDHKRDNYTEHILIDEVHVLDLVVRAKRLICGAGPGAYIRGRWFGV